MPNPKPKILMIEEDPSTRTHFVRSVRGENKQYNVFTSFIYA